MDGSEPLRVEHPFSLDIPVYAPEHVESRISAVVRGFDFASVHRCMELLRWTWGDGLGSHGVPTIEQLRETATDLLGRTLRGFAAGEREAGTGWRTGGFSTSIDERGQLDLRFELRTSTEQLQYCDEDDNPLPAGYLCVGDPRTWRNK